jgi:hypothetical protein
LPSTSYNAGHLSKNAKILAAFVVAAMLMLSVQSGIGFQSWNTSQQAFAQSSGNLVESKDSVIRSFTYPTLRFDGEVVADHTDNDLVSERHDRDIR